MHLLIAALKMLSRVEFERIARMSRGKAGYTAAQYADAAIMLLDSKHHAIAGGVMLAQLGRHVVGAAADKLDLIAAGEQVFQRLVEANALSLRPKSGEVRQ